MNLILILVFSGLFVWILSTFGIEPALAYATLLSGSIWGGYLVWKRFFAKEVETVAPAAEGETERKEPLLVDYARSFFPIFLFVLLLRAFVVEPFRIPSGSMMPTLLVGDFILVNKYSYGLRMPVTKTKLVEIDEPKRGDVVVFRYPRDPKVDYIKRLVGLPGDRIAYRDKKLYVNGKLMPQKPVGWYEPVGSGEDFGPGCQVLARGEVKVPEGHYFMMGDNRDNSNDSRCWGFVPESNLVGKAFVIWLSIDWNRPGIFDWSRIGQTIH